MGLMGCPLHVGSYEVREWLVEVVGLVLSVYKEMSLRMMMMMMRMRK